MVPDTLIEMGRLSLLTGNIGRLVTRFIERHFVDNSFVLPVAVLSARSKLDLAVYLSTMRDLLRRQIDFIAVPGLSVTLTPKPATLDVFVTVTVAGIPEGMKDRQELLGIVSDVLQTLTMRHVRFDENHLRELRLDILGDEAYDAANPNLTYFDELVRGDYTHLSATGFNMVGLAAELNPAVHDRMRELLATESLPA